MNWTQDDWTLLRDCLTGRLTKLRKQRPDADTREQISLLTQAIDRIGLFGLSNTRDLLERHWRAMYLAVLDLSNRLSEGMSYSVASSIVHSKQLDRLLELMGPDGCRAAGKQKQEESDALLRFLLD